MAECAGVGLGDGYEGGVGGGSVGECGGRGVEVKGLPLYIVEANGPF